MCGGSKQATNYSTSLKPKKGQAKKQLLNLQIRCGSNRTQSQNLGPIYQQNSDAGDDALKLVHDSPNCPVKHKLSKCVYDMLKEKVDRLAGKMDLVQKKTPKISFF